MPDRIGVEGAKGRGLERWTCRWVELPICKITIKPVFTHTMAPLPAHCRDIHFICGLVGLGWSNHPPLKWYVAFLYVSNPFQDPQHNNSMNLDMPFWCISGKSKLFLRMNESATYQLRQLRSEKALGKARLKAGQVRRWNVGERGIFSQICPAQFSTAGAWRWKWFDSNLLPFSQVYTLQETMPFPARKSYSTQKCRLIGVGDGQLVPYRSNTNLCS